MNREEIRELAAVYALGGLDGEDRARFEALLRSGDEEATAALRDFEATLSGLATESAQAPPPSVKAALMERIGAEERVEATRVEATLFRWRRALWPAVWAATVAAGIAAIIAGLSISQSYDKRLDALAREAGTLRAEVDRQRQLITMLGDPATQIVPLSGLAPAPSARARMIWNENVGGLLVTAGLPGTPPGRTYQLWAIVGKKPPVSGGVFDVDAKGTGSLRVPPLGGVGRVVVFAVTLEPAGGVPAPSGPMYLAGKS